MFKKFPTAEFLIDGHRQTAVNILTTVLPQRLKVDSTYIFQRMTVPSGARPESIAAELYNKPSYYWTILLVNDIVNPYLDWPMSDEQLEEYVKLKYNDGYAINHFIDVRSGRRVDDVDDAFYRSQTTYPEYIRPVTNYEYERELNQERTKILVINPRLIEKFVEAYNRELEPR